MLTGEHIVACLRSPTFAGRLANLPDIGFIILENVANCCDREEYVIVKPTAILLQTDFYGTILLMESVS